MELIFRNENSIMGVDELCCPIESGILYLPVNGYSKPDHSRRSDLPSLRGQRQLHR